MRSRGRFQVLPWGFFLEGEDPLGDHGLGSLVESRFKAPPGTSYSYIITHLIGTSNCASWASQPQKSFTLRPQPGGDTTKSIRDMWWHWGGGELREEHTLTYNSYCLPNIISTAVIWKRMGWAGCVARIVEMHEVFCLADQKKKRQL
jgi:hypothetical protein